MNKLLFLITKKKSCKAGNRNFHTWKYHANLLMILLILIIISWGLYSFSVISYEQNKINQSVPQNRIIRLANGNWPPYNGEDLPNYGFDTRVITESFALEGIGVEYIFLPWARGYNMSAGGKLDGAVSWADVPEFREKHFMSEEPTSVQEWVFFYRKDNPLNWKTMDDLAGKIIGITVGYAYNDVFNDIKKKNTVTFLESSNDKSNFRMLLAKRIDAFPMVREVGNSLLKSIFKPDEREQILSSSKPLIKYLPHLALSKAIPQNEQIMILFNRGFKKLKKSGRYAQIMRDCGIKEKGKKNYEVLE
jgi:polar amino acid transport system substrate-binding protein